MTSRRLVLPIILSGLIYPFFASSLHAQQQWDLQKSIHETEREYVLSWKPPDTPLLAYSVIIKHCDQMLTDKALAKPNRRHLHFVRGVARWCLSGATDALGDLHKALSLAESGDERGIIEYYHALVAAGIGRKPEQIESVCNRLLKSPLRADVARAHVLRAVEAISHGEWAKVLERANQALENKPDLELAFFVRAYALYNTQQYWRALENIQKVRGNTVETDRVVVEYARSLILIKCGKHNEAVASTRRATQYFKDRTLLWGLLYEQERRRSSSPLASQYAALQAYRSDPKSELGRLGAVLYCLNSGKVRAASKIASTLPEPSNAEFLNNLGFLRVRIGLGDRQAIDRAIARIGPANMNKDLLWRAVLYLSAYPDDRVRDGRLALEVTKKLPPLRPKSKHYALCRAIEAAAHAECGEWEAAMAAIEDAMKHARDEKEKQKLKELQRLFSNKIPYRLDPSKGTQQPLFVSFFVSLHEPDN